ncbi:alpha/beta fold hydrolase [Rufibacter psychrotolerans]|uniref:alpha/beta fold hydrolase n=1 Tax=Rufibacter psychrotolerans TaxID=2812556 RepID=UPI0019684469|nr:alpha/beta hydrolase [Rufibacter sp. SYSU D00308]
MKVLIENQDTKLFTIARPNTGKETVILLHGGPGVPDGLTFLTDFLSRKYQVITFHQRGTLKSPNAAQEYSLESYLSDINRIAAYFKVEKFHLFGHSWGGLYAQLYAQHFPNRLLSLFLCSPASGTGRQWKDTMLEISRYNKAKCSNFEWISMNLNAALGLLGRDAGYRNFFRQVLDNFSRGFREAHPESFAIDCIKATPINQTVKAILAAPLLPDVPQPGFDVTITYGDQDIFGESKNYVLQRYPTAHVRFIPESGHIPWSHNQKEFVQVLKAHYGV